MWLDHFVLSGRVGFHDFFLYFLSYSLVMWFYILRIYRLGPKTLLLV
jgi:hypothetical protein